jgi:hypothetical protein
MQTTVPSRGSQFLWNLGLGAVPRGRGVLLLSTKPGTLLPQLINAFEARLPRMNRFTMASTADLKNVIPIQSPWPFSVCRRLWLQRLKIQVLVLNDVLANDAPLISTAQALGITTVLLNSDDTGTVSLGERAILLRPQGEPMLQTATRPEVICYDPDEPQHAINHAVESVAERVIKTGAVTPPGRIDALLRWRFKRQFRELRSADALRQMLGRPNTILCLGNGPSSEDPGVVAQTYDALMRVNHSWQQRGLLTSPSLVFTGQFSTLQACGAGTPYVFQSLEAQQKIYRRSWWLPGQFKFLNAETAQIYRPADFAPYKPTNGAVMIATAVALQPQRIIIAGIDFFDDPRGAYPGHSQATNAYTPAHSAQRERAFIISELAGFNGEVEIIGDVLSRVWQSDPNGLSAHKSHE